LPSSPTSRSRNSWHTSDGLHSCANARKFSAVFPISNQQQALSPQYTDETYQPVQPVSTIFTDTTAKWPFSDWLNFFKHTAVDPTRPYILQILTCLSPSLSIFKATLRNLRLLLALHLNSNRSGTLNNRRQGRSKRDPNLASSPSLATTIVVSSTRLPDGSLLSMSVTFSTPHPIRDSAPNYHPDRGAKLSWKANSEWLPQCFRSLTGTGLRARQDTQ
jgi:hypothetical protein